MSWRKSGHVKCWQCWLHPALKAWRARTPCFLENCMHTCNGQDPTLPTSPEAALVACQRTGLGIIRL
eukprot:scaffold31224_cov16-Tisochrysis_lutea.AAC.1